MAVIKKLNSEKGTVKMEKKKIKISMTPPIDPMNCMIPKTCLEYYPSYVEICIENINKSFLKMFLLLSKLS